MRRIVGYEIKTLENLITREIIAVAKKEGYPTLTTVQIRVMRYLFKNIDREVYQKDIEKNFVVRRSTASGIIDTMEKNGMLKRIPSEFDARSKQIVLTDKYINKMNLLEELIEKFQDDLLNGISDSELNTFFTVIDKMKDNLNKKEDLNV